MPSTTRRTLLNGAGTAAVAALAGCALLDDAGSPLSVAVINHTDTDYQIDIGIYDAATDHSRAEARVWDRTGISVPAGTTVERTDIVDQDRYLIRYRLLTVDGTQTDGGHIHYYPDGDDPDTVVFDLYASGVVQRR